MVIFENIDIDKAILKNIDIEKVILKNIDMDKEILENIDMDIGDHKNIDKIIMQNGCKIRSFLPVCFSPDLLMEYRIFISTVDILANLKKYRY